MNRRDLLKSLCGLPVLTLAPTAEALTGPEVPDWPYGNDGESWARAVGKYMRTLPPIRRADGSAMVTKAIYSLRLPNDISVLEYRGGRWVSAFVFGLWELRQRGPESVGPYIAAYCYEVERVLKEESSKEKKERMGALRLGDD